MTRVDILIKLRRIQGFMQKYKFLDAYKLLLELLEEAQEMDYDGEEFSYRAKIVREAKELNR